MLKIEEINTFEGFQKLEPIWNDLLSQSDSDFPFLTFEWLTCWWKSYGEKSKLLVLLAKEGNDILGIAPLMITKTKLRGLPVRAVSFVANYNSNRSGFILIEKKKEVVSRIMEHLFSYYNYDIIWLDFIVKESDSERSLRDVLNKNQIKYITLQSNISPYISLETSWEQYRKDRSKNLRKELRKANNRLKRYGNYEIARYANGSTDEAMEQILSISCKSWKHNGRTAIGSNRENINFYTLLAKIASSKNWLDILMLKLNGSSIAFKFMLNYKERTYDLKMGYDERYHNLSPGTFLFDYSLRNAFENRRKEMDLLGDGESHKMRWTSTCREHNKYWIFGNGVYGRALSCFESLAMPGIRKLLKR